MPPKGRRGSELHHAVDEDRAGLDLARRARSPRARSRGPERRRRGRSGESLASRTASRLVLGARSPPRPGRRSPRRRRACPCSRRRARSAGRRRRGPSGTAPPSSTRAPRATDSLDLAVRARRAGRARASGPTCGVRVAAGRPCVARRMRVGEALVERVARTGSTTMKRLAAMQLWPLLMRRASAQPSRPPRRGRRRRAR